MLQLGGEGEIEIHREIGEDTYYIMSINIIINSVYIYNKNQLDCSIINDFDLI